VKKLFAILGCAFALCAQSLDARAEEAWKVPGLPSVVTQSISFEHDGAMLHGTLYRPGTTRRVPAIVVLHGAEVGNADAALYRHLREGLPAMGVAVLLFDRRGTGSSTGSLKNVSYETLTDDGIAGARAIAKLPSIDASRIGYWGLSQGGWLAVFAAKRDSKAAFAISVSAPLVTPERQMEFAMSNRLRINGYSDADAKAMLDARKAWTGYLRGDVPRATAVADLAKIDRKPWFDLMYMPSSSELTTDPSTSSWRKQMDDDPVAAVQDVRAPVLFIFGGADPWIPVGATIDRLRPIAKAHPGIEYAVVADASHEMMFESHETMAATQAALQTNAPEAPAYFMLLASWLEGKLGG
jgi:pimeloyl-ACP methyl ester carboxylesterase